MAQVVSDRRDIDFVLYEQFQVDKLSQHEKYADFNKKTIDMIVSEARNLAIKELLPANKEGDEQGCHFENGTVTVPESFHKMYKIFCEGEWVAMSDDPDLGGQGMPHSVAQAANNYFLGANLSFSGYMTLTHGAGKLVEIFGTEKQKELYLRKLYTGQWTGTMLLTEAGAGSDVGALTTTARKNGDGTYTITGEKLFISAGEHNLSENIVHPVLARIEGAPPGTKGISLFLVPKYRVNHDGSIGEPNDVVCSGIEEKLGIHGWATCTLALGARGGCTGTLLGDENKGMMAMFVMMNEARLGVGLQGFALADSSYINAVNYSRERIQGKHLLKAADKDAPPVPIIEHADVKRQLLKMKAYVDGMRSLLYYVAYLEDLKSIANTTDETARLQGQIDFLIPICKGYGTDRAFEICSQGIEVYGGYGYISEYPQEQLLRDCKITQIYEGTNGIQAMDLLGRKLGLNKGSAFKGCLEEMGSTVTAARDTADLAPLADTLENAIRMLEELAQYMGKTVASEKVETAFSFAHPFMEATGDVTMAWMLLWRATVAAANMETKKKDKDFYQGQILTAKFFINTMLPVTLGKIGGIMFGDDSIVKMSSGSFGGK